MNALLKTTVAVWLMLLMLISQSELIASPLRFGDIVVVQQSTGNVVVFDPSTGNLRTVVDDFDQLSGASQVAFDRQGRMLTATRDALGVFRFDFSTGQHDFVATGPLVTRPFALAMDHDGSLLIGDAEGWIIRANLETGVEERIARYSSRFNEGSIQDIEVGRDGTIYLLDFGTYSHPSGRIVALNPTTGEQTLVTEGGYLFNPGDMVIDAGGNLIVENTIYNSGQILRVDTKTGIQQSLFYHEDASFIALDRNGDLIMAQFNRGGIMRADLATGEIRRIGILPDYGNPTGIAIFVPEPHSTVAFLSVAVLGCYLRCRLS